MNFLEVRRFLFLVALAGVLCVRGGAQGLLQADSEEFRRLRGDVQDLQDKNAAQQRVIADLSRRIESLQEALRDSNQRTKLNAEDFVTREALKKALDQIEAVDRKRESDRKVILEQLEKLGRALSQPPMRAPRERDNDNGRSEPAEVIEGKFYPHKVEEGQTFGEILQIYNESLKRDGRRAIKTSEVRKVNPGFDPDRIRVGQEILLPVPDKK